LCPPVWPKNGLCKLALGYGRKTTGAAGRNVGVNVYPWMSIDADGNTQYFAAIEKVSEKISSEEFAVFSTIIRWA
jgi:RNase H-fold protein (predicted Holliday junction resolvase)